VVFQAYRKLQLSLAFGRRGGWPPDESEQSRFLPGVVSKHLIEPLRDILMSLPPLLEAVFRGAVDLSEDRQQAIHGLVTIHGRLRHWKESLDLLSCGPESEPNPKTLLALGYDIAHSCLLYWCACQALYKAVEKLKSKLTVKAGDFSEHDLLKSVEKDEDVGEDNIMTAAKLLVEPEAGLTGITNVCLPMGIFLRYDVARRENSGKELNRVIESLVSILRRGALGPMNEGLIRRISARAAKV
jgi:hypothetical protein